MKRIGFLIEEITDLNNLYNAFYKACKGKKNNLEVLHYKNNLYNNLKILQNEISTGEVNVGNYKYFTIYEPKKRLICAASFPERVLHHAIMNVCHKYFENQQIEESYATRVNKGTYKAIAKAKFYSKHNQFYLKLDIRKYFDSISHTILKQKLETVFKDPMLLLIFDSIINSYQKQNGIGLPIGNLTSQYFANFYLSKLDRYIKKYLKIKPYVRYMDDMVVWDSNPKQLTKICEILELYLNKELNLNLKIKYINTSKHGLNFLSYRIFSNRVELQQKAKKRFIKKIKFYEAQLKNNLFSQLDYQQHVTPLIAFTKHASSKGFRKKVFLT